MSSERKVGILPAEYLRFPGPKVRSKDVADGQQVEIPVLQYNRTVGTQRESTSGNGIPRQAR